MKCLECIKEGKKSIVTEGFSSSFSEHAPNRWNQDGELIVEEHNTFKSTTAYSCSNGHNWSKES